MQITISFRSGFSVEGVVLSASEDRLRVAMRDWDDAAEFLCCDGHWFAENLDPVEIAWPVRSAEFENLTMDNLQGSDSLQPASGWVN